MHLIGDLDYAGAQEVVRTLVKYLASEECTPLVCSLRDGPLRHDIEKLGVKVEVLGARKYPVTSFFRFIGDLSRIRRQLIQLIATHRIDVIQTHLLGILDFLVLTLFYGSPLRLVLWTVHNVKFLPGQQHWLDKPRRIARRLLYRLTTRKVSGFIAVSEEVRLSILNQLGAIDAKVFTISNGVDVTRFEQAGNKQALCQELGLEQGAHLAIVVGRLHEQKGHRHLIEAVPTIIDRFPQTRFLFIGEGELKASLEEQVKKLGLEQQIIFAGIRQDVPEVLAAVDLFVLPSLWEGLSIALLEAMAAAKPIVATAVSGTNQVMISEKTGLLVPPNSSQALAEAILRILANPAQAQRMGRAARRHVIENFSAQKQATEHLNLYKKLLSQG